jgi:hypothetical protein
MTLHYRMNNRSSDGLGRMPNFLVIGAAKAGTTSLWHQLDQHPQIFMHPAKKLNFFAIEGKPLEFHGPPPLDLSVYSTATWQDYCLSFNAAAGKVAVGEVSNSYLYSPDAAGRIRHYIPNARLIAVLRHPAERAYSRFLQVAGSGRERITNFVDALHEESARVEGQWWPEFHYLRAGLYHAQLARYYAVFPADQIKVYLYEDMLTEPVRMLQDIFRFLNVDPGFKPSMDVRYSASGLPKKKFLDWTLRKLRLTRPMAERLLPKSQFNSVLRIAGNIHARNLSKPRLSPEAKAWMIQRYRDDTLRLQDLIQRDLSAWLR